jgi:hypothetical protein
VIRGLTFNEDAWKDDPLTWEGLRETAGKISLDANRTSAMIGITYNDTEDGVLIGPRGKAAIAVEFGHRSAPGKRYVKKAIDRARVR